MKTTSAFKIFQELNKSKYRLEYSLVLKYLAMKLTCLYLMRKLFAKKSLQQICFFARYI